MVKTSKKNIKKLEAKIKVKKGSLRLIKVKKDKKVRFA